MILNGLSLHRIDVRLAHEHRQDFCFIGDMLRPNLLEFVRDESAFLAFRFFYCDVDNVSLSA